MEGTPGTEREAPPGGEDVRARGAGATLGEAKWAAMKELEHRFPGVDADSVRFEVVSEGDEERGEQAEVVGEVVLASWRRMASELQDDPDERLREVDTHVCKSIEPRASVDITCTEAD